MRPVDLIPFLCAILGAILMKVKIAGLIKQHQAILDELVPALKVAGPQVIVSADGKTAEVHSVDPVGGYTVRPFPIPGDDDETEIPDPAPVAPAPAIVDPNAPKPTNG